VAKKATQALRSGKDTISYTSRKLVRGKDAKSSLSIGKEISKRIIACFSGDG
jgi:hypothetical protein